MALSRGRRPPVRRPALESAALDRLDWVDGSRRGGRPVGERRLARGADDARGAALPAGVPRRSRGRRRTATGVAPRAARDRAPVPRSAERRALPADLDERGSAAARELAPLRRGAGARARAGIPRRA